MLLSLLVLFAAADEGMWLSEQIPQVGPAWRKEGLSLSDERLGDPMGQPLGSIVSMGFCSASFVSADGLIATNHHCASSYLQYNSTAEANRHHDGYTAADRAQELPVGPTGRIQIVESSTDVTRRLRSKVERASPSKRYAVLNAEKSKLVARCERRPNRRCHVETYRGGGEYRLVQALELRDVRLVYAPAYALGQFGGEVDNWMWPRHTADFALLRAYVAPDGSSADFDTSNVPYSPKHHLEINPAGAAPGSFVMAAGFPGRTSRHAPAQHLDWYARTYMPARVDVTDELIGIVDQGIASGDEARAKLGSARDSLSNARKNNQGLLEGLRKGGLIDAKLADERAMLAWIDADAERKARWSGPVATYLDRQKQDDQRRMDRLVVGYLSYVSDLASAAHRAVRLADEREKPDSKRDPGYQLRDVKRIGASFERMQRGLHLPTEQKLLRAMLLRYQGATSRLPALDAWLQSLGGLESALRALYDAPALATVDGRLALLELDRAQLRASDDPFVQLAVALERDLAPERAKQRREAGDIMLARPVWFEALEAWRLHNGAAMYDDANSSLRLTLGHVKGYAPQDGLWANPQTTLTGLAAKAGEAPFDISEQTAQRATDGASSARRDDALGDVVVNFLTTLDTTGGSSGSAVLDGEGRFVGLVFDGNYESIPSDWVFLDGLTRTICVDVRFMLWVLDGDPAASWILKELERGSGR